MMPDAGKVLFRASKSMQGSWRCSMTIGLDHVTVPSHNRFEAAKFLAGLLGVPWELA